MTSECLILRLTSYVSDHIRLCTLVLFVYIRLLIMRYVAGIIFLMSFCTAAFGAGVGLTLQGRILKADNTPVTSNNTQFKIQVRTSGAENCLLYEEVQTFDMTSSSGLFNLTLGQGTRVASTVDGGYAMDRIFANRGTLDFSATVPSACAIGTTFTPAVADSRRLTYSFNDGVGGWQIVPATEISWVPFALESLQVGGYKSANLLRVADASGVPQAVSPFLPAEMTVAK